MQESLSWWKHLSGNFEELLQAECRQAWEWETLRDYSHKRASTPIHAFIPETHQVLLVRIGDKFPYGASWEIWRVTLWKTIQNLNKCLLSKEKGSWEESSENFPPLKGVWMQGKRKMIYWVFCHDKK